MANWITEVPKLSIGFPVYNPGNFLIKALDSLLSQKFQDYEIIISDNASEDETEIICKNYMRKDRRIVYYRAPKNMGASKNFLRTFMAARGEYFMWASHSDTWDPQYTQCCIEVLERDRGTVLCYSAANFVNSEDQVITICKDAYKLTQQDPCERYVTLLRHLDFCNSLYGVMRAKEMYEYVQLLTHETAASDPIFLAALVLQGKFVQLDEPLFTRLFISRQKETLEERFTRIYEMDKFSSPGISLPFIQFIKEFCDLVKRSSFSPSMKNNLLQQTVVINRMRYGAQIKFELNRAIQLISSGHFYLNWGEKLQSAPKKRPQPHLDTIYLTDLYVKLEIADTFLPNYPALKYAKAILLLLRGRRDEAQNALECELKRDPKFKLARQLLDQISQVKDKS